MRMRRLPVLAVILLLLLGAGLPSADAKPYPDGMRWRQQLVRILGTTLNNHNQPVGVVGELVVGLEQRDDHRGIVVTFDRAPGQFSPRAQAAVLSAIDRTARTAGLNTDSWSVSLAVPSEGLTVYGESLSAMVGLTVVALARGDFIPPDHVITGTVTQDGRIGTVSGVPLKVEAAGQEGMKRILVPEQAAEADGEWRTPFLAQVSPVQSVPEAYEALTGRPLQPAPERR
jgi:predicted S18 family serine protease